MSWSAATVVKMNIFVGIWIFVAAVVQIRANSEVNVTVFYESLCPDSIRFIRKQLYPTYKVFRDYMNVEFVPFGKASIKTNPWRVACQHGRNECLGNTVQACALARHPEPDMQIEIVHCHMTDRDPPTAGQKCARKLNYDYAEIKDCSVNKEGRELLTNHRDRTRRFRERLSFVPTILFNDEYSSKDQTRALSDLKAVVCKKLEPQAPEQCRGKNP